jgi:inhibitor of KinA
MGEAVEFSWSSECTLRVDVTGPDDAGVERRVLGLLDELRAATPVSGVIVRDLVPAYATLTVVFEPGPLEPGPAERWVREAADRSKGRQPPPGRVVRIPVCYGGEFGPDLDALASLAGLTPAQVIERHSGAAYRVRYLGFVPGFAYLAGLPIELHAPRLDKPRQAVPAGGVGIAGNQTGVYPRATPGGWRLIGRTPLRLFDPDRDPPNLLGLGDQVRFEPISPNEFTSLEGGA